MSDWKQALMEDIKQLNMFSEMIEAAEMLGMKAFSNTLWEGELPHLGRFQLRCEYQSPGGIFSDKEMECAAMYLELENDPCDFWFNSPAKSIVEKIKIKDREHAEYLKKERLKNKPYLATSLLK